MSDTVDAQLTGQLVVELRDSNNVPIVGASLRFTGENSPFGTRVVHVARSVEGTFTLEVTQSTDANGRAAVRVQFGRVVGRTSVLVTTSDGSRSVTAEYDVSPGAPASVIPSPTDTVLYVGSTYLLDVEVLDRYSNPVKAPPPVFQVLTPETITRASSGEVAAVAIGRGKIEIVTVTIRDTAFVSVPPVGTLVASQDNGCCLADRVMMHTFNLDGSDLVQVFAVDHPPVPSQSWGLGETIAFNFAPVRFGPELIHVLRNGELDPPFVIASELSSQLNPRYSRDGAWIYFNGGDGGIWRVRDDGGELQQISAPGLPNSAMLDPSPDGARLAFQSENSERTASLRILTLTNGSVDSLDVFSRTPRWSPDGQWIAYVTDGIDREDLGKIGLIRPDGSENHIVDTGAARFDDFIDWSPDGDYLIANSWEDVLTVVVVASGEVIPLSYSAGRGYRRPAWRR